MRSNTFVNDLLKHIFQNADIPLVGDATGLRGSTTVGNLYIALHTADPGAAGNQTTSEASYTGYGRIDVARNSTNWGVTSNTASNNGTISFAQCTAGSATVTYFSVGTALSGTGKILYRGALTASRNISAGITPKFDPGTLTVIEYADAP